MTDLIEQVAFLHQLLQQDEEDVRFRSGHGPGSVPFRGRRDKQTSAHISLTASLFLLTVNETGPRELPKACT